MQDQETCQNCHRQFPSFKIHSHFSYCLRNIKKCPQCDEMVDMNHFEEHNQEFHSSVPCGYCKKEFEQNKIEGHKKTCEFRTNICQYCEQSVPLKHFEEHQEACGARTSPCPICQRPIVLKKLEDHAFNCQGKPPEPTPVGVSSGNSYQDYINRERQKLGMQPKVISTTVTVRSDEPSAVRVLPIQKVTIKPTESTTSNPNEPRVIRYQPTQIQTRTVSYKSQTLPQSFSYSSGPNETTRITYVTRQPVESKITYVTKEPVITRRVSEVKYEEGVRVYGGIESMQTTQRVYGGEYQGVVRGTTATTATTRIPGFEDQDEELQRALMESMMMQ